MTSSINEDLMVNKLPFYNPIELKEKDQLIEFHDDDTVTSDDPFGQNTL